MKEIRRRNLHLLAFEATTQANLAQRLGMEYREIVTYFKNVHTSVSDSLARHIEVVMNKPNGWMDRDNCSVALTDDEWSLLFAYRAGTDRDRVILRAVASTIDV